jgi:hypothetical protein
MGIKKQADGLGNDYKRFNKTWCVKVLDFDAGPNLAYRFPSREAAVVYAAGILKADPMEMLLQKKDSYCTGGLKVDICEAETA